MEEAPRKRNAPDIEALCRSGSAPPGRPLTPGEQNRACELLLDFAERILHTRTGPRGVEYAGIGLVAALRTYDGCTPLRAWVVKKVIWTARTQLHKAEGRPGTARHAARRSQLSLSSRDQARRSEFTTTTTPHHAAEHRDLFVRALETTEQLEDLPRIVALGRMIGGFDHRDIADMLDISAKTSANSLALVRRSVFVD